MMKYIFGVLLGVVFFSGCKLFSDTKIDKKEESVVQSADKQAVDLQVKDEQEDTMFVTLKPGLKYKILKESALDAEKPNKGDTVLVHYTGWLEENGKEGRKFDSSLDREQPFKFNVGAGEVIKGWDEGVLDMKVGQKRRFVMSADFGYGSRGAGGVIPGNATLIFDIELLDIE